MTIYKRSFQLVPRVNLKKTSAYCIRNDQGSCRIIIIFLLFDTIFSSGRKRKRCKKFFEENRKEIFFFIIINRLRMDRV